MLCRNLHGKMGRRLAITDRFKKIRRRMADISTIWPYLPQASGMTSRVGIEQVHGPRGLQIDAGERVAAGCQLGGAHANDEIE